MNKKFLLFLAFLASGISLKAQSESLYKTITKLDSIFVHAYNTCDIATQEKYYSDSIEFFHDKGGLSNSKKEILEGTKKFICGKVTRELVKGSIEVSPIPGYGAVELGSHTFHNNHEKDTTSKPSKFVIIWRNKNNKWTITRVISLH